MKSNIAILIYLNIAFFLYKPELFAQSAYQLYTESEVYSGDHKLLNAWTGGLNNPQFSIIDLNLDNKDDLFIFDRSGNKLLVFLNKGEMGEISYEYAPEFESAFPQLHDWAIFRDLNCDNIPDLITSNEGGVAVYYTSFTDNIPSFELYVQKLKYTVDAFTLDLEVTSIDIPAFVDVNGDGDVDVLTFDPAGGYVDYFENREFENGAPCGTLQLEHISDCWGHFYESGITKSVELGVTCDGLTGEGDAERSGVHAGSTLLATDENNDGLIDLILGDLAFNNLNRLRNGGDSEEAIIIEQDTIYPSNTLPVELPLFPAAFLIDIDNDDREDMLVAPNSANLSENFKNVWFYRNISEDESLLFEFVHDSLLVSDMTDVGKGASPVFFDHNQDGLLDIVSGNFGYLEEGGFVSKLALFENIGTAELPAFQLKDRDYAGLSIYGFIGLHPTFWDLDNDGDEDLLIGEEDGIVHFFRNDPIDGEASFTLAGANYQGIDAGKFSTPHFFDVNGDELPDLIIGERNGNLNYYENQGSVGSPDFVLVNEFFGKVDVRDGLTGYSTPFMTRNSEDELVLYVGSVNGKIFYYEDVEVNLEDSFSLVDSYYGDLDEGEQCALQLADLNSDGKAELLTGNYRGGLSLYKFRENSVGIESPDSELADWHLFPNPARDYISFNWSGGQVFSGPSRLIIMDVNGKAYIEEILNGSLFTISTASLSSGVYFYQIVHNKELWAGKFVIGR